MLSEANIKNAIPHYRALQFLNLQNGINKVGLFDLIIAQQSINGNIELWSLDKDFQTDGYPHLIEVNG